MMEYDMEVNNKEKLRSHLSWEPKPKLLYPLDKRREFDMNN
jgi:hypothetical protein